ncbi:MAG TPA: orotidine-5'-phosphate decarboxylase [Trebonia sp.]
MAEPFAARFAAARDRFGPLVFGADPHASVLARWNLTDDAEGLERFTDIVLTAASDNVGLIKPQSAFYERHGWRGVRALARLAEAARERGILVIMDVKRGDVGSTNDAYAQAYIGDRAPLRADALTVHPYLGLAAMDAYVRRAHASGACLLVVTRSSNPEGRAVQEARTGLGTTVEEQILSEIATINAELIRGASEGSADPGVRVDPGVPGGIGPVGAVIAPSPALPPLDLVAANALFLVPGVGAQGATPADVAATFAACPERVMPSVSRSLLAAGPDPTTLRDAAAGLNEEFRTRLGPPIGCLQGRPARWPPDRYRQGCSDVGRSCNERCAGADPDPGGQRRGGVLRQSRYLGDALRRGT